MPKGKKSPGFVNGLDHYVAALAANIGERLARAVAEGIEDAVGGHNPPTAKQKSALPDCVVPSCGRPSAARGLCSGHYTKARRLGFIEATLNTEQLNTLARDGRKPRFSGQAK